MLLTRRLSLAPVCAMLGSALVSAVVGCQPAPLPATSQVCSLDQHAREYGELVAALAERDPRSVDSPVERPAASLTAGLLRGAARNLRRHIEEQHEASETERAAAFGERLRAFEARAEQIGGARFGYADEMAALFGNPPIVTTPSHGVIDELGRLVPGSGPLATRVAAYDHLYDVPPDRLQAVVMRALALCRQRTVEQLTLPAGEHLDVSFVQGALWSGYSRYQGGYRSTMEINTQYPLSVDRALDLACHEGYPGHHVINSLREAQLVVTKGWAEAGPLLTFSPAAFAAEALASAAPRVVFTTDERLRVVRDELFPLAGLDAAGAERHVRINLALAELDGTIAAITQAYLTGQRDAVATAAAFRTEAAMAHSEATVQFITEYRAYATAYSGGRAAAWRLIGPDRPAAERWRRYRALVHHGRLSDVP